MSGGFGWRTFGSLAADASTLAEAGKSEPTLNNCGDQGSGKVEQNKRPGWYYVGGGRLRFMNAEGWTEEYRNIDEPEPQASPEASPAPEGAPTISPSGNRFNPWVIAATVAAVTAVAVSGAWATGLLPSGIAAAEPTMITSSASAADRPPPVTMPPGGATNAQSKRELGYLRAARKLGAFPRQSDAKVLGVGNFACETARKVQPDGKSMLAALASASEGPHRADYKAAYTAAFTALCPELKDFWTNAQNTHRP